MIGNPFAFTPGYVLVGEDTVPTMA